MTYGDYQEAASRALVELLTTPLPQVEQDIRLALASRAQIIATVTERMEHLGAGHRADRLNGKRTSHASVVRDPLDHLARLVDDLERPALGLDLAPSDVLRSSSFAGPAETWRTAAGNLFLATSELLRAERRPWLEHPSAGWPLVADLADTVESLLLLDRRLGASGHLRHCTLSQLAPRLLVAYDVGRVARLNMADDVADLATAGWGSSSRGNGPAIAMVRTAGDFAEAQRRLAAFIRPFRGHSDVGLVQDRPGLKAARVIATGQTALAETFAAWAVEAGHPDTALEFRGRVSLYRALHASTARLVDLVPGRSPLALIQQSEMSTRLRSGCHSRLSGRQLAQLNAASHELTVSLGKALRREGLATLHIQVLTPTGAGFPRPTPITNGRHPFHRACKALADTPPPASAPHAERSRVARRQLRETLDAATWSGPYPLPRIGLRSGRGASR
jgi:hypothetical protein